MDNKFRILKSPPILFILLFSIFCTLLFFKLSATDKIQESQANELIETIMKNWIDKNYVFNYDLWEDYYKTPPIHSITNYEILNKNYHKKLKNKFANYDVRLDIPPESFLPSGQVWHAILILTPDGWRVRDFTLSKD